MNVKFYRCEGPTHRRREMKFHVSSVEELPKGGGLFKNGVSHIYTLKGSRGGVFSLWLMTNGAWKMHTANFKRSWQCVEVEFI